MRSVVLLLASALGFTDAVACSFSLPAPIAPASHYQDEATTPLPVIKSVSYSIRRGTDKDETSCAELGVIELLIEPLVWKDLPKFPMHPDFGYQFELIESSESGNLLSAFFTGPIGPVKARDGKHVFRLVWVDGAYAIQTEATFKLKIHAVDNFFRRSAPCEVLAEHRGGPTTLESSRVQKIDCVTR